MGAPSLASWLQPAKRDVIAALAGSALFRTWVTILVATELLDDLREPGPWLVLAPTDEAFARLPPRMLEGLFERSATETLVDLAERHVARSRPRSSESLPSLLGERITIDARGRVCGGEARVTARQACDNGAIVVVDRVLLPASLRSSARRSIRNPAA